MDPSSSEVDFVVPTRRDSVNTLNPNHKIFLGHSGVQKNFVEQLCVDLEKYNHHPFFDKRHDSLPIGMNFPKLIFEAIMQCEVGVVLFSEEFFTRSKWPMLELMAMKKNPKLAIIPVLFGVSLEQVHNPKMQEKWLSLWHGWAQEDKQGRIDIGEWCRALEAFRSVNCLVYIDGASEVSLRKKIIKAICYYLERDLELHKDEAKLAQSTNLSVLTAELNYNTFAMKMDTRFVQTENTYQFLVAADNMDLIVIKKVDTGTNSTEVHILTAASKYTTFSLQTGMPLKESDHTWSFGLATNRDLFAIKRCNNASNYTEVNVLTQASRYQTFSVRLLATALHQTDHTWQFLVGTKNDLYVIKKQQTGTKTTEVHMLTAASNYQSFGIQTGTTIPETSLLWDFFGLDFQNNIYAIHRRPRGAPELYILESGSNYQQYVHMDLQLPKADHRYAFGVHYGVNAKFYTLLAIKKSRTLSGFTEIMVSTTPNFSSVKLQYRSCLATTDGLCDFSWITNPDVPEQSDLCIVKKNHTESGKVEVVFLQQLTNFKIPSQRFVTPVISQQSDDTCEFRLAKTQDLVLIKKSRTDSNTTEIHILSWASHFQSYSLHTPTFLHQTDHTWTFLVAQNLDVIAIHKSNTASNKTEYMELLREGNYQVMGASAVTGLDETDDSWDFVQAPNRDLYAIQKYGTSSGFTEVKVLSADSKWSQIKSHFQTALPMTDYNYSFCLTDDLRLVAI